MRVPRRLLIVVFGLAAASLLAGAPPTEAAKSTGPAVQQIKVGGAGVLTPGAPVTLDVKAVLDPRRAPQPSDAFTLTAGSYTETIPLSAFTVKKTTWSFRKAVPGAGIQQVSVSFSTGKFALKAAGIVVGAIGQDIALTLALGPQVLTAEYEVLRKGKTASWKTGQKVSATVQGRVLVVGFDGEETPLSPAAGLDFVRNDVEEPDLQVYGDPSLNNKGQFTLTIEATDPALLTRETEVSNILGTNEDLTHPQVVRLVPVDHGELSVVVFVQKANDRDVAIVPGEDTRILSIGGAGIRSGLLVIPADTVSDLPEGFRFTPLNLPLQLPAPLPEGYAALAGAEILCDAAVSFPEGEGPRVELEYPDWRDTAGLDSETIVLLEFVDGAWSERPGVAVYDPVSHRIVPDETMPARLGGLRTMAYALAGVGPERTVRGRFVSADGDPLPMAATFTKVGSSVTDVNGSFEISRAELGDEGLEVVQLIAEDITVSRALSAAGTDEEVVITLVENPVLTWQLGQVSGTVFEDDGTTPVPGATVSIRLHDAVRRLQHDDNGTPANPHDDSFAVDDLSALGVTEYRWSILLPGESAEYPSTLQTGNSVRPADLILEASIAGHELTSGAVTIRASYDLPGAGTVSLWGGFQVTVNGITVVVSDVNLGEAYEGFTSLQIEADADGVYSTLVRSPAGFPLEAMALKGANASEWVSFQHTVSQTVDLQLGGAPPPPPPPAGDYSVVDLSTGSVTYLSAAPSDLLTNTVYRESKMVFRRIPAGTFTMGAPPGEVGGESDEPLHSVVLTQDFWIGVFEVTQGQYTAIAGSNPSTYKNAHHPVETISWNDARGGAWPGGDPAPGSYMDKMRMLVDDALAFDLPTEAQWEYACRAGTTTALNSGKNLTGTDTCPNAAEVGRYIRNRSDGKGGSSTNHTTVGSYLANQWGLYDMHGNITEWCLDWFGDYTGDATDPAGPSQASQYRDQRGGCWWDPAPGLRSAGRGGHPPGYCGEYAGFRAVFVTSGS